MFTDYGEYVTHVLGLLNTLGILIPLRNFVLLCMAVAGFLVLLRMLRGGGGAG